MRGGRAAVTLGRERVLLLARHLVGVGDGFAGVPHVPAFERTPEPVVDHRIDDGAVAHAQAFADARQQVRAVAHRFHAAGDGDLDVTGEDALLREHHGLQPRAAHLVDRERGDVIREAALERRLPRRRLAGAGRDDVAHDAFVHRRRIDARAADRFADDHGAELGRGEILQRAEKLAGRQPNGTDDDRFAHVRDDSSFDCTCGCAFAAPESRIGRAVNGNRMAAAVADLQSRGDAPMREADIRALEGDIIRMLAEVTEGWQASG